MVIMNCPICGKEMKVDKIDTSHNSKNGREYEHTIYICGIDDVWIVTEIPKKQA